MRTAGLGRFVFAAMMIAFGVIGLIKGDFSAIWQPVAKTLPAREGLAYLCALVSLGSGVGLLIARLRAPAARVLLAFLLLWVLFFRVPALVRAPATQDPWSNVGETAVIIAGAWVMFAWFAVDWDRRHLGVVLGTRGLRIASVLYGLAMIPFGIGHFTYLNETAGLVPHWLPGHFGWAYLTGGAYLAAAVGVLFNVLPRLAVVLSTLQMGAFTVLVWFPIVAAGSRDPFVWSETLISIMLTAAGWVVADSLRDRPWLRQRSVASQGR